MWIRVAGGWQLVINWRHIKTVRMARAPVKNYERNWLQEPACQAKLTLNSIVCQPRGCHCLVGISSSYLPPCLLGVCSKELHRISPLLSFLPKIPLLGSARPPEQESTGPGHKTCLYQMPGNSAEWFQAPRGSVTTYQCAVFWEF